MKKAFVISSLLVVLTLSLGGSVASKSADSSATYEQLKLFTEVLSIVQNQYVDEVPPKDLIYNAIKGTLRGLDPHSSFLDPDSYKEMQVETSGSFGGLGIEITLRDDVLTVVSPIEGTPAHRAGLLTGDRIVKIDGLVTKDMQLPDAVKRMRGKPGTKVTITVVRELAAGGPGEPGERLGLRDRRRRAPGLGQRDRRGQPDFREGLGADDHSAVRRLGAPAHDRQVLHAEGPIDPRQGHHAGHRRRDPEGDDGGARSAAARARPDGGAQEGHPGPACARRDQDDADHRAATSRDESSSPGPAAVAATHASRAMPGRVPGTRPHRPCYLWRRRDSERDDEWSYSGSKARVTRRRRRCSPTAVVSSRASSPRRMPSTPRTAASSPSSPRAVTSRSSCRSWRRRSRTPT